MRVPTGKVSVIHSGELLSIRWEVDGNGLAVSRPFSVDGWLDRLSVCQSEDGASGTYDLEIVDELGCDYLDGMGATQPINGAAVMLIRANVLGSGRVRRVYCDRPVQFVVSGSGYGSVELYTVPGKTSARSQRPDLSLR